MATAPRTSLYLPGLEASLPDSYDSELFVVGRLIGLLDALGALNNHTNHAPSIGFLELEVGGAAPLDALRERYAHRGPVEVVPCQGSYLALSREALGRVALAECEELQPLARQIEWILDAIVAHLAELFADRAVETYALGGSRVYGYISDDTLAFVVDGRRVFVLGLGWTD